MKRVLIFSLLLMLLGGCSTQEGVPLLVHDTVVEIRVAHDSVYQRDSVYVGEYVRGDTVYCTRWHDRWRERLVTRVDTVRVTDYSVKTEVRRYVPRFYRWSTWVLWALLAVGLAVAVVRLYVRLRWGR